MEASAAFARVPKITGGLVGVAGEHFVAAELARLGFLVTLTRGNAPGVDVLAYRPETRRTVALQVKATVKAKGWMLSAKDEGEPRSDAFVLVFIPGEGPPEYRIIPSRVVAETIREGFLAYRREDPTRDPSNTVRYLDRREVEKWRDRWDEITRLAGVEAAT